MKGRYQCGRKLCVSANGDVLKSGKDDEKSCQLEGLAGSKTRCRSEAHEVD